MQSHNFFVVLKFHQYDLSTYAVKYHFLLVEINTNPISNVENLEVLPAYFYFGTELLVQILLMAKEWVSISF